MSSYSVYGTPRRLLPPSLAMAMRDFAWRALGLALFALALSGWISLMTWSINDPSINHMADRATRNLLGWPGATLADLLLQLFGLAAIFLLLPVAVIGAKLMLKRDPGRVSAMAAWWAGSVVLLMFAFSHMPVLETWPLAHGLGGLVGDFLNVLFARWLNFFPGMMGPIVTGALSAIAGLWLLLMACGLRAQDLSLLWQFDDPARLEVGDFGESERARFRPAARQPTSYASDFSTQPREYWMRAGHESDTPWAPPEETGAFCIGDPADGGFSAAARVRRPQAAAGPPRTGKAAGEVWYARWRGALSIRQPEPDIEEMPEARIEPFFGSLAQMPPPGEQQAQPVHTVSPGLAHETVEHAAPRPWRQRRAMSPQTPSPTADAGGFRLPPISLLSTPPPAPPDAGLSDQELTERAQLLEDVLQDFGVKGEITEVRPGPVITLYELRPARGTKSSRVIGLADDIARSMGAVSARVAVVAGRDALGIELPNHRRETVYLRALLETCAAGANEVKLPLSLGKSISGEPVIADLARMPHLLIAGTTGSGKSVGINTMILSLIYRLTPEQCRFIMIDPKMLELSVYDGIPHLLTPVVTEPKKAIVALKWTVAEMNRRYELMSKLGVRNIQSYNQTIRQALERGEDVGRTVNTGFDPHTGEAVYVHEDMDAEPMPYIVVVIDEMADLMMVAGKDIEFAVQRLSQMARAAGIHLIMATQRPSVDVITGTIKANFPTRISFQVSSKIDSRTILGDQGAEQLLGAGDMLYLAGGGRMTRVHGPFVSDKEVEAIVQHLRRQGPPDYRTEVLEAADEDGAAPENGGAGAKDGAGDGADLYDQAVEIVLRDRKPTTSYLQRRLGIGYNRAASLIERMEDDDIISAPNRAGRREILIEPDARD